MKNLRKNLQLLMLLLFAYSAKTVACDLSSFTLNNVTSLGNNKYKIDVTFCAGNGKNNQRYGADQSTTFFSFYFSNNAKYAGTSHDSLRSIINGVPFYAIPHIDSSYISVPYKADALFYLDTPSWGTHAWTCIQTVCGAPGAVCRSISLYTVGLPDTIWLRGMEAAGNTLGGCTDLRVFPKCWGNFPSVSAGSNQTVYLSGSPSCATLTAAASGGAGSYTYKWNTGATIASISVCPTVTTIYKIKVLDANGCPALSSVTVTPSCARTSLTANAGANQGIDIGVTGSCVTLSGSATGGFGTKTYKWSTNATTSSISVCPTTTTTYSLIVKDGYNCRDTDDVVVKYRDVRCGTNKVNLCYKGKTICAQLSMLSYYLNRGATVGSCGSLPKMEPENELNSALETQLFPNPTNSVLNLVINGKIEQANIVIQDLLGRTVKSLEIPNTTGASALSAQLDVASLSAGIYYLKITDPKSNYSKEIKFVKQ